MAHAQPDYADMPGLAAPLMPTDAVSLAALDMSDRGNAARFVARHGDRFLFVRGHGWHVYTGTHWSREGADSAILNASGATVAAIVDEAKALEDAARRHDSTLAGERALKMSKRAASLRKWSTQAGSINRLRGLLSVCEAKLVCDLAEFDRDPYALNVRNGTLRFHQDADKRWQVRLDKHNPDDRLSRLAPFAWNEKARTPTWEAHLARMVPDVFERLFFQRVVGYCALGERREQCFFLLQGRGGDGKSVSINTTRRVLGSYVYAADVKTFLEEKMGRSAAQASPDLARLAGATRLVSTSEPPRGSRLNEGLIKQATGGQPMTARHLNRDPFEFLPTFALVIECNARPAIGGSDDGIWRRVHIMPWRVQLKKAEMETTIEDRMVAEGEGVLAWIVAGALSYMERGLDPPESIETAHADYKRGSNAFREWLEMYTQPDAEHVELMARLYGSYKEAMESQGFEPMSQKAFGLALGDHQIMITAREPGTGKARRKGARIRSRHEMDFTPHSPEDREPSGAHPIEDEWVEDDD